MRKSLIAYIVVCLSINLALAQNNGSVNIKYGDQLQLVTNDSFWYKGMFILQNDSALLLQKLYADNFYVLKKNIALVKINDGEMKAVTYQDSILVESNKKIFSIGTDTSINANKESIGNLNSKNSDELSTDEEEYIDKSPDFGELYTGNYFISESAIQLPKRCGYYKVHYLLFHTFSYSLTDHFSIGAGTELFTLVFSNGFGMLNAKYSTTLDEYENIHLGVKYTFFTPLSSERFINPAHLVTGIFTWGTPRLNFSGNFGGLIDNRVLPVASLSGYYETYSGLALVSESVVMPYDDEYTMLYSLGIRFLNRRGNMWEIGCFTNKRILETEETPVIPYFAIISRF